MGIEVFESIAKEAWERRRRIDLSDERFSIVWVDKSHLRIFLHSAADSIKKELMFSEAEKNYAERNKDIKNAKIAFERMMKSFLSKKFAGRNHVFFEISGIELLAFENIINLPTFADIKEQKRYKDARLLLEEMSDDYLGSINKRQPKENFKLLKSLRRKFKR